ncbi:hypothetical protein [Providencia sp. PROV079]|uniref:hypothetical protein n=1 Tax=Providencia sp. PROV079 TaxID=2949800 RepID=UPI0023498225|nr:hypothetical protein [Providencia sp. PROV079]
MKKIMITALLALFLSGCDNSPPAPYGFKWGQSVEDIQKLNLDGEGCSLATCTLENSPDNTDGKTLLIFTPDAGLVQILHSEELERTNKTAVMDRFDNVIRNLKSTYGDPTSKKVKIDDESDFFACLDKIGCSDIYAEFIKGGYSVFVSIGIRNKDGKLAILTNYSKPLN